MSRTPTFLRTPVLATTAAFFATEIFQGMARYLVGDSPLVLSLYLPKMLMAGLVFASVLISSSITLAALPFLSVIAISLGVGYANSGSLLQTGFGLWVLIPAIFGFVFGPDLYANFGSSLRQPIRLLWLAALGGVLMNYFVPVPWTGSEFDVLGQTVEGSREWTTQGISRLAGFSRASYAVASQLLMLGLLMLPFIRRRSLRSLCWIATGTAITLSTTKATIVAWVLCSLYQMMIGTALGPLAAGMPCVVASGVILVPMLFADSNAYFDFSWLGFDTVTANIVFNSAIQRFTEGWPDAFQYVSRHGLMLTGTGIGGFGAAAKLFDPDSYNPGDNIMVGLYLSFGIWALIPLVFFVLRITPFRALRAPPSEPFHTPLILAVSAVSLTTYILEDPLMSLLLGAMIRVLVRRNRSTSTPLTATSRGLAIQP